jgi:hypothetical protein
MVDESRECLAESAGNKVFRVFDRMDRLLVAEYR